ncbi:dUTP diphosphatase [Clostridium sp. 'deep sea']|uniref:dUTP diphosphatase n=1 Tax=Clostridium sp. 'deep sea' TaxID=2779445 RepID=UPI0018969009|nr:dUTP diphosphatase [Clostridium sp. 'deep sea']QOR34665.1 dUTP diphosphatase [Clostridium sp. 'deep sea']
MSKVRGFEKISINQFVKDIKITESHLKTCYANYQVPQRGTAVSAGYDFYALQNITLQPGEQIVVPTGIKAYMQPDEWLAILVRSSHGFKYNLRLMNQVGVIDADYYNNPSNEGHIFVALKNEGNRTWQVKASQAFAQGIFMKYLCVDGENPVSQQRLGGIGSTDRRG